jgi:tripartite-type tricarboxylate transporter receptor subunit TctC
MNAKRVGVLLNLPLAVAALSLCATVSAQTWPARPISIVVGTPPGGGFDAYARTITERFSRSLGQQVLVDNKPSAAANVGAEYVAKSAADGYTLLVGSAALIEINPLTFSGLRWKLADFRPIIKGVEAPLVFVTHPKIPARNFPQFAAWLKSNRGKIAYASFSPGTPSHFLGYQLNERLAAEMVHVPYKGSGPQVNDLIGGHVLLGFTQVQTALPHVKAGRLNALATTGAARFPSMPDVPTFEELGEKDFITTIWFGLFARATVPDAVHRRLVEAAKVTHTDPETRAALERQGFQVSGETDPEFSAGIKARSERWARLIKASGFKSEE